MQNADHKLSAECVQLATDGSLDWGASVPVSISVRNGERTQLTVTNADSGAVVFAAEVPAATVFQANQQTHFVKDGGTTYAVRHGTSAAASQLAALAENGAQGTAQSSTVGGGQQSADEFSRKTDAGSASLYFHYYGMLQHQQNMLQDYIRTGTYNAAILENRTDFEGKTVMDVGAGSGILSLFAVQAGAAKVYAVEASDMAHHAQKIFDQNPGLGQKVEVVKGRLEELKLDAKVDVLISEPMGTLLVNERMLETYIYARKHFLKPGGKMYPQIGRIHVAAFSDEALYAELVSKAAFWLQGNFYGIAFSQLHTPALSGYFQQVVVDAVDPSVLVSRCATRLYDFAAIEEEELHDITIPLDFSISVACAVHGVACWFDVLFNGTNSQRWLSTAPGQPTTHWFQLRCVLEQPISVQAGDKITGELRLVAHSRQSRLCTFNCSETCASWHSPSWTGPMHLGPFAVAWYDIFLTLEGPPLTAGLPPQRVGLVLNDSVPPAY